MHGHLLRQTSTQSLGKPGATRYYWDPPGWHRVSARAFVIHHCCGIPASVAAKKQKQSPQSARMRAVRAINLIALLLRAGDVHPNPGPSLHVAQFNVLGFSPGKKISLLHKAKMLALDVVLLQELHVTEDEASRLAIPGFHCFAVAHDAKGGGVAVLVRDALQCSLTSQSVSEVVEHTTVCVKVGDELSYFTSAYFPRGHKVSAAALSRLSQDDRRTHIIGADTNCHHEDWDRYVAPNPGGTYVVDFCIDQAYTILNTGEPTRRSLTIQKGQLSAPDVTLARGCIGRRWQAKPDPDSDHFFITFDIVIGDAEPLGSQVPNRSYHSWDRALQRTAKSSQRKPPLTNKRSSFHGASQRRQRK